MMPVVSRACLVKIMTQYEKSSICHCLSFSGIMHAWNGTNQCMSNHCCHHSWILSSKYHVLLNFQFSLRNLAESNLHFAFMKIT